MRYKCTKESPWSCRRWKELTFLAFHSIRTYAIIMCIKQNYSGTVIVSLNALHTRLSHYLDAGWVRAGFREFFRRYKQAVVQKKRTWAEVDCRQLAVLERNAFRYFKIHPDIARYLEKIDKFLKEVFGL